MTQAAAPTAGKGSPDIMPHRFLVGQSARNVWRAHIENGHTRANLQEPEYWKHLARRLTPGDLIEVLAENGAFYGELLVRSCDKSWAKVAVLTWKDFDEAVVESTKLDVVWKGPVNKHCVIRISDGEILAKGFQTKDEGAAWVEAHKGNAT